MRKSSTGAMIANSTIVCELCASAKKGRRMSVTPADHHVRVGDDVDRVTQEAGHEPARESEAHDQDHIYVVTRVGVVARSSRQVETLRVRVADVEKRLVHL